MLHKTKFSDVRLNEMCVYCGAYGNTMDHVTSKVILDAPLPENLHKIPCRAVLNVIKVSKLMKNISHA